MTSELKSDLRYFDYKDGHYISECKTCGCQFLGDKRSWACKPCAEKKAIEPKVTRAVPDVPELDRYGKVDGVLMMKSDGDYVLYSQAAEIIAAERSEKHRAQEAVLKLERELAQYEAQVPVKGVALYDDQPVLVSPSEPLKDGFSPLYASPAPAADLKEKSRHD